MEKAYDIHIYVCVYGRSESHSMDESQGGSACDLEIEPLLVAAGIRQQVIADGQGSNLRLLHMFRSGQTSNAAVEMLCSFREGPLDCQIHQGRGRFEQARLLCSVVAPCPRACRIYQAVAHCRRTQCAVHQSLFISGSDEHVRRGVEQES